MAPLNQRTGLFSRIRADDDFTSADEQPADFSPGLASLGYIGGALRRGKWFWIATALAGLLLGVGFYQASPTVYRASTLLVLKVGPEAAPGTAIQNEQVIAESRPVAALALKDLKLPEDVSSFMQSYTVAVVTDSALSITASAPSSEEAQRQAKALANAYLQFRTSQLEALQKSYFASLDETFSQQLQTVRSLRSQLSQAGSLAPGQRQSLRDQLAQARTTLSAMRQNFKEEKSSSEETTAQQVKQSGVVNPAAPVPVSRHAHLKQTIIYGLIGLIVGMVLGLGILIVRALMSDRLRRRDDVAYALGAPVKLSVGRVEPRRWLPGLRGRAAAQGHDIQRITAQLGREVPRSSDGVATLAVVPVDSTRAAAMSVVGLAMSYAEQGERLVLADLAPGRPAASLLDTAEPGVRMVSWEGGQLALAVPDPDDDLPVGPLGSASPRAQSALAKAVRSADLLLALVTLDPALGGEHLVTWATDAVVMVTAGRSSWTKIHAAGEMVRLSGTRLVSGILVGADKTDESLGVTGATADRYANIAAESLQAEVEGGFVAADRSRRGGQPGKK